MPESLETAATVTPAAVDLKVTDSTSLLDEKPVKVDEAKPAEPKVEEAKKTDEKPADKPTGAPEKYEFKAEEGKELDTEFIKSYEVVARELDLPQDKAQTLIDRLGPVLQARQLAHLDELRSSWKQATKTDKEIGGDKLNESLGLANSALEKFGSPELREIITASGLGNNLGVIRFLVAVSKATSGDTFVGGHKPDGAGTTAAQKLYPNQK